MVTVEQPTFDSEASRRIYQYVERNGGASSTEIRETVDLPGDDVDDHLERLVDGGLLEERDGVFRPAVDVGTVEQYETPDFTYTVRTASDEDFEQLVDTIEAVTAKRTYAIGEQLAEELRYDGTVSRRTTAWSRQFFVATDDDYVVGWSHLDLPMTEKLRNTAQLTIGVLESYRGYGIGKRLMDRGLEWAEENGYEKVYNSVAETNGNAITFLERHGWEREAVRKDHYTIGDRRADEVMMAYWL
jgi:ribosomal protein S18 acetylase RimI-like enzyme